MERAAATRQEQQLSTGAKEASQQQQTKHPLTAAATEMDMVPGFLRTHTARLNTMIMAVLHWSH